MRRRDDDEVDAVNARVEQADDGGITDIRMAPPRAPKHQPRQLGAPFGVVGADDNLLELAHAVVARIFRIRRDENCGSYVMARPARWRGSMEVYVISEASLGGMSSVRQHPQWQVGRYAAGDRPADPVRRAAWRETLYPSVELIHGDLMQQALDLEIVTPGDIYARVRYGEG